MENEEKEVVETQETSTETQDSKVVEESQEELDAKELKAELDKLRAENGALKYDIKKASKKVEKTLSKVDEEVEQRIERIELRAEGYSDDQISEIIELGGKKVLNNQTIKNAFELAKKQVQTEKAGDIKSSGAFGEAGFTGEELKTMSSEDYLKKVINKGK